MTSHRLSAADRVFKEQFESGEISPAVFDHRAHVRMAYVYLAGQETEVALRQIRDALRGFLRYHEIDPTKYHETLTRAWVLAVRHFMETTRESTSADAFVEQNPILLDAKIMLTHYSADLLFSDEARARFVDPDLAPIPRHRG